MMKNYFTKIALGAMFFSAPLQAETAIAGHAVPSVATSDASDAARYVSVRNEIYRAIERGNEYLKSKQAPEGYWGAPSYPAVSGLVLTAALRSPLMEKGADWPEYIKKGYDFLLGSQKEDGGIYDKGLASYNTSVSMLGLLAAQKKEYDQPILKARKFLINQQNHFAPDNPFNGGIGYGGKDSPPTADLSNTALALEAIYYSRDIAKDGNHGEQPDLDWDAAIQFLSRCQDLPETNDQPWAHESTENKGGFAYLPKEFEGKKGKKSGMMKQGAAPAPKGEKISAAREPEKTEQKDQKKEALRTYGSMSYAGLQSLIYAQLKKDDPRVKAVLKWLGSNYTTKENPGMGIDGLYYYYQTMAKALSAAGIEDLTLADGSTVDWRDHLAKAIVNKQRPDGSWVNTSNRWWETDPVIVTSYMVLALEQLYNAMPSGTAK